MFGRLQHVNGRGAMPEDLREALASYCQDLQITAQIEIIDDQITLIYPVALYQADNRCVRLVRRCRPDVFHLWTLSEEEQVFFFQVDDVIDGAYLVDFDVFPFQK